MTGCRLLASCRRASPELRILMLTMYDNDRTGEIIGLDSQPS
jgi:DNA-binding NarL/FixJ family response regulator